jgi:hypothetical protein
MNQTIISHLSSFSSIKSFLSICDVELPLNKKRDGLSVGDEQLYFEEDSNLDIVYCIKVDRKIEGFVLSTDPEKFSHGLYKNGYKVGKHLYYNHRGLLEKEIRYSRTPSENANPYFPNGISITHYDDAGRVIRELKYLEETQKRFPIFLARYYYPNGEIKEKGQMIRLSEDRERKIGFWSSYDESGEVME